MPVAEIAAMTDADLKAVWAYLRSIPAIHNRVPEPRPPVRNVATPGGPSSGSTGAR